MGRGRNLLILAESETINKGIEEKKREKVRKKERKKERRKEGRKTRGEINKVK